jgi:CubicO group peptidase (beta-lactamase class C family)
VKLQSVVDQVFSDPAGQTLAFVLVYKGQIVAERYGHGANRNTLIEGWSMGKSLLAALIGVLIKDGEFGLYDRAPVPEWQRPGDPRSNIRIVDLLRMSGGLHFTAPRDPDHALLPFAEALNWIEASSCSLSVRCSFSKSDIRVRQTSWKVETGFAQGALSAF